MNRKVLSLALSAVLLILSCVGCAENANNEMMSQPPMDMNAPAGDPPAKPDGKNPGEMPPGGFDENGTPGNPPDGMPNGMGGPGGSSKPEEYNAVNTYNENVTIEDTEILSAGSDENAVLTTAGETNLSGISVERTSDDSTGGDSASFYGVGAAMLVTGGTMTIDNATINTDSEGGAGVFAYGDGVAYITNSTITTMRNTSGGIHAAGGGTLYATNVTVVTNGESSAAIRSDRGGGTMVVEGGSYTANGSGSPAVYVTADITISNAELIATGSEALCLEGKNSITLNDCDLQGNMKDLEQNDNTWNVILYQSMSGDSEIGKGTFTMTGGSLTALNGGMFYTTNTTSEFVLNNVELIAGEDSEYLLRCTGNANQRGWGTSGSNGASCTFTAIEQSMTGTIIWDSISDLQINLTSGTKYTGAIIDDESCAGDGGNGECTMTIDESSEWIVTGDSYITSLNNDGSILDSEGMTVSVIDKDGSVLLQGTSPYTIYLTK